MGTGKLLESKSLLPCGLGYVQFFVSALLWIQYFLACLSVYSWKVAAHLILSGLIALALTVIWLSTAKCLLVQTHETHSYWSLNVQCTSFFCPSAVSALGLMSCSWMGHVTHSLLIRALDLSMVHTGKFIDMSAIASLMSLSYFQGRTISKVHKLA